MNAKKEFLNAICTTKVKCAYISTDNYDNDDGKPDSYTLQIGWGNAELETFLNSLDFEYDAGYGCQKLFGTIWLYDDTWLERWEYDGSEGWVHRHRPDVPDLCVPEGWNGSR